MKSITSLSLVLKNKERLYEAIDNHKEWNRIAAPLLLVSGIGFALFGLVMATYYPTAQHLLELTWKMIVLVWGSVALCTPSLYVFSAVRGSRLTLAQLVFLLIGALATMGIVLLALTPITWFFIWTAKATHFIQLMNGAAIACSLLFGALFLGKGLLFSVKGHEKANSAVDVLLLWGVLLVVVLIQMADKLGPWYPFAV